MKGKKDYYVFMRKNSGSNFLIVSLISLSLLSVVVFGTNSYAKSDKFPTEPIDIIVPYSVGGGTDIWMRTFSVALASKKNLRVPINIRNMPGAASLRGTGAAFKAKPDGYTLVAFNPPSTPWSWYTHQPPFDINKLTGITVYVREPGLIVVREGFEYQDFESLFEGYRKGKIKFIASLGEGTVWHIASLLLKKWVGLEWKKYISYKGCGDIVAALYRKEIDVGVCTASSLFNPVQEGTIIPIAMIGLENRLKSYPDTPTLSELGKPSLKETVMRRSVFGPPGMPKDVQTVLEKAFISAQDNTIVQSYYKSLDLQPAYGKGKEAEQAVFDSIKVAKEIKLRDIVGKK
ncbi:MAG: tripartite tricarboxylate transporter substrate binding protein [Deltaproteobacteria bacterium]|nr:tripartite tricarboxylate transporter substrate binding protein [Deltaproteobacteria bacterium]